MLFGAGFAMGAVIVWVVLLLTVAGVKWLLGIGVT